MSGANEKPDTSRGNTTLFPKALWAADVLVCPFVGVNDGQTGKGCAISLKRLLRHSVRNPIYLGGGYDSPDIINIDLYV